MKHIALVLALAFACSIAVAAPIPFEEVSLLVRMKESEPLIVREVAKRTLLRGLTPEQEATLKQQGASDALLRTLRKPEFITAESEAAAFEARQAKAKEAAQMAPEPASTATPGVVTPGEAYVLPSSYKPVELHIEKIVIKKHPIPAPYFVHFEASAQAGRVKAAYNIPGKTYGSGGLEGAEIEIPVNLKLKDVQKFEWATLTLRLDHREATLNTPQALKKHTGRIEITDEPDYVKGRPYSLFIVSLDVNQHFVYEVYWKLN